MMGVSIKPTSAHEESQLLDMVGQYWDPGTGSPSWKAIGLLLGCTADTARHRWKDKSTRRAFSGVVSGGGAFS